jgi:hypothetical protein
MHDALHEHAGRDDVVKIDLAGLDQVLDLADSLGNMLHQPRE